MRFRHWVVLLSFLAMVVGPTAYVGFYLFTYAADQYVSRVGFAVRNEESSSAFEFLGNLSSISGSSSSDTDILYEFIQTQEMVVSVNESYDLREIYSKPEEDWYFRLEPDASIEDLVAFWGEMVLLNYDPGTGLIEVEVRAFDPQDAQNIAQRIFDRSNAMINELSAVARSDLTRYAQEELDQAVERLKEARQALTIFRNRTQIVDPSADIQGQMGLLNSLQAQLADTLIEQDLLAGTTRDSDPRVQAAQRRAEVIQARIEAERRKMGMVGGDEQEVFADLVGQFESLQVGLEFAEEAYLAALSAYDSAVAEARRQSRYLAAYLRPTLAETPEYPQRWILLTIFCTILVGTWTILILIYYSVRDRR